MDRIKNFFLDARHELRHVNWPTREEAVRLTVIVIIISLGISLFLGAFDYVFGYLLKQILK